MDNYQDNGVLLAFIEKIERLEEERKETATQIKDVYSESKGAGFEPKLIKQIIKLRKMDEDERLRQEAILSLYKQELGMPEA